MIDVLNRMTKDVGCQELALEYIALIMEYNLDSPLQDLLEGEADITFKEDSSGGYTNGQYFIQDKKHDKAYIISLCFSMDVMASGWCTCRPEDEGYIDELGCVGLNCDWMIPRILIESGDLSRWIEWKGTERDLYYRTKMIKSIILGEGLPNILINGRIGSGKDVVADYLVDAYGYTKITFADYIYKIARELFGMKNKDRRLLQSIGQKMREIDPNVWVDYTYNNAEEMSDWLGDAPIVISDCRQENEYLAGIERGYFPIRILADEETRVSRVAKRDGGEPDASRFTHESETGADKFSFTEIENNSTLTDLYTKIDGLMYELRQTYAEDNKY